MAGRIRVTSADFIRNIGHWQNEALRHPVSITHHGRERLVLATPEEFDSRGATDDAVQTSLAQVRTDADAVVDNLDAGFLAFDVALRLTRSNRSAEALIGRTRDALNGLSAAEFLPDPFSIILRERLERVARTRKPETFEAIMNERHLSVRVFPLSEGPAVLLSNTTEQHEQKIQIGLGDALCAAMNRHPDAAGVKMDVAGRITGAHSSFCAWVGVEEADLLGKRLIELLPVDRRRDVADVLDSVATSVEPQEATLTMVGSLGRTFTGVLTLAPIRTEFITHGVMAVWVPRPGAVSAERAA